MDHSEPVIVRLLVAKGGDGQTHTYALTVERLVIVDKVSVRLIEASPRQAQSFRLVTDTGAIEITGEDLCMLISGRLWTEPVQGRREASRFARTYPPQDGEELAFGARRTKNS